MSDNILSQDLLDELEFEPSVKASRIGVAVEAGVVPLTGHVPTYPEKFAAENAVRRVKDVKGIALDIEVRPVGSHRTADDELVKRVLALINWKVVVPEGAIQVIAQTGWLTLIGSVGWKYQQMAAGDAVKELPGVIGVSNLILVKPPSSAVNAKKRITAALKRDAEFAAGAVLVERRGYSAADDRVSTRKLQSWPSRP